MQPEGANNPVQQRCAQCGDDNPSGAVFCGNCGAQLRSSTFDRPSGPVELNHTGETPAAPPWQPSGQPPLAPPPINTPGAGLTPDYSEVQHYDPQPQQHQQQPAAYNQQAYVPPVSMPNIDQQVFYPQAVPPGSNTSGMGEGYPLPPETSGWNWGGFVPFGLFSFMTGNATWGVIGLVSSLFSAYLVYSIIIGATGKQMAWKSQRFESIQEYEGLMRSWNTWGLICFIGGIVLTAAFVVIYMAVMVAAFSNM